MPTPALLTVSSTFEKQCYYTVTKSQKSSDLEDPRHQLYYHKVPIDMDGALGFERRFSDTGMGTQSTNMVNESFQESNMI